MQVIATAGHVDHGKSTLVRTLTGMEPDRWAEERRRGLSIDLGFAWLTMPSGQQLAFVDVPGHERFVPNMLAGVGPVPAVLFVVAADAGWMPQSAEHLAAIDALGISRGLLAVTRADLADPRPALRQAIEEIAATSLGQVEAVPVSAVTGQGLPELLSALDRLIGSLPVPDPDGPVRLWVDRVFGVKGSGTVVTGTLPAGLVAVGDELQVTPSMRPVRVRGIQSLREPAGQACGVARIALNVRGVSRPANAGRPTLARGMALVQPGRWTVTCVLDVRLMPARHRDWRSGTASLSDQRTAAWPAPPAGRAGQARQLPGELTVHIGSARTVARVRLLGGSIVRLTLPEPLPLHIGDRLLLRDPGAARSGAGRARNAMAGAVVLDVMPPPLAGRGAARAAAIELGSWPETPTAAELLRRHGLLRASVLHAMGLVQQPQPVAGEWLADPDHWAGLRRRLPEAIAGHLAGEPLAPGMPLDAARSVLGLPDRGLVEALARPALAVRGGYIWPAGRASRQLSIDLPEPVLQAVRTLLADLAGAPFAAPDADRIHQLGLDARTVAAAERAGLLLRVSERVVLASGAAAAAAAILARLPQPFTAAQARQALGTTRRVAIPLLEHLDRTGVTRRLPDDRRMMRG